MLLVVGLEGLELCAGDCFVAADSEFVSKDLPVPDQYCRR